jgi:hypothetical protein
VVNGLKLKSAIRPVAPSLSVLPDLGSAADDQPAGTTVNDNVDALNISAV